MFIKLLTFRKTLYKLLTFKKLYKNFFTLHVEYIIFIKSITFLMCHFQSS